tara:strand:- start:1 stop:1254 length:1254 start_codon:yes stop_codon:yes gene_type:complete
MNPITNIQNQFVNRNKEIRTAIECIIAGGNRSNLLFVGPPGTGKSMVTACLMKAMSKNSNAFHTVFTHMSRPADVFGPQDIAAFTDQGKLHYKTEGFAPDCEIVRLEEGTKATGPLQDMCLAYYADRIFTNGNTVQQTKTKVVFIDSNELPNETNGAMLDRFYVIYFPMLESTHDLYEYTGKFSGENPSPLDNVEPSIDLNKLMLAHSKAMSAIIPPETALVWNKVLQGISLNIDKAGTKVSASSESSFLRGSFQQYSNTTQRGQGRALSLAKARATRMKRSVVLPHDLAATLPALWTDFNFQKGIQQVLYSHTLPGYAAAVERSRTAKSEISALVDTECDIISNFWHNQSVATAEPHAWSDVFSTIRDAKEHIERIATSNFPSGEVPCEFQDLIEDLSRLELFCHDIRNQSLALGV